MVASTAAIFVHIFAVTNVWRRVSIEGYIFSLLKDAERSFILWARWSIAASRVPVGENVLLGLCDWRQRGDNVVERSVQVARLDELLVMLAAYDDL